VPIFFLFKREKKNVHCALKLSEASRYNAAALHGVFTVTSSSILNRYNTTEKWRHIVCHGKGIQLLFYFKQNKRRVTDNHVGSLTGGLIENKKITKNYNKSRPVVASTLCHYSIDIVKQ
jgi:hypothetical protein